MEKYQSKQKLYYKLKLSKEEFNSYWKGIKEQRKASGINIGLTDKWDRELFYNMTDKIKELLGNIKIDKETVEEQTFEEGFYSANIEGATTTLERYTAITGMKDIARNKDEYMSKNTYIAENYLKMNSYNEIDHTLIKELHRIITDRCLEDGESGKYRTDTVSVVDGVKGIPIYTAPEYTKVEDMLDSMIEFIAYKDIDPILKGIITHFYFVHVHPFQDGNGRTARLLHLKVMHDRGKELFISKKIAETKSKYYKAIRTTEEEGDLTYFIEYILEILN